MECREVNVVSTEPVIYIYIDTERKKMVGALRGLTMESAKSAVLVIFCSVWLWRVQGGSGSVIVSKDGNGDYRTVGEAILKAPEMSEKPYTIHVRAGTYQEYLFIPPHKTNIRLIGDGPHLTKIVAYQKGSTLGTNIKLFCFLILVPTQTSHATYIVNLKSTSYLTW